jgi:hypothetical protein
MIDLEKILEHLDKKIKEEQEKIRLSQTKIYVNCIVERISFLQMLRGALTIEETYEKTESDK